MNFRAPEIEALRTLVRVWAGERFVLIGASALRCTLGMRWPETYDLDAALAVSLERYPAGLDRAPGWSRHPNREHTWIAPGKAEVNVIPIGDVGRPAASVTWPLSGFEMLLTGLHLAFEHCVTLEVASGVSLQVAPPEVVAVLKMVSYMDRPYERERDLQDLAWILTDFVGDTDERRFMDDILDLGLGFDEVSPYLLGARVAALTGAPERAAVHRFIRLVGQEGDAAATQARMLVNAPPGWHRDPDELVRRIAAFERGFGGTAGGRGR
jgi:predicted nucleotidyltransferase